MIDPAERTEATARAKLASEMLAEDTDATDRLLQFMLEAAWPTKIGQDQ